MRLAELDQRPVAPRIPVSTAIKRFEKRLLVDRDLQKEVRTLQRILKI